MNISSEVGLNMGVPYRLTVDEMALRQATLEEIGDEGIRQSSPPTISDPLHPPKTCECGCGGVLKPNRRFVWGHNNRWLTKRKKSKRKRIIRRGYFYILQPEHPNAEKVSGYVREHVLVVTNKTKKPIKKGDVVHHINMEKLDNKIENLWVCNILSHRIAHTSINKLIKRLLDENIIEFDREEGKYIMKTDAEDIKEMMRMKKMTKYECPLCPKEYQSKKKLDRHCKRIHGKSLEEMM